MSTQPSRLHAYARKDLIIDVAIWEFAKYGLYGSSTERVAKEAGISQPYIFKLFGNKQTLFLACVARVCDRIQEAFAEALVAGEVGQPPLKAMAMGYVALLAQRNELLVLLHAFAASADAEVQRSVRGRYQQLYHYVHDASQAPEAEAKAFLAQGLLLTVGAALELPELETLEEV